MNNIDFSQTGGFPLDANLLKFMQESYQLLNVLGELAGNFSILKGCKKTGSTVSDGVVYINGEVLPFKGGAISDVVIKSEKTALQFEDGTSHDVEELRYATFGISTTSYKWSDFKRIKNLKELMQVCHELSELLKNHTHAWSDITAKPLQFPPTRHSHSWGSVTDKPLAFPPTAHTHSYNDLADKPNLGGRVVVAGRVGASPRRVLRRYAGSFTVTYPYGHSDWECEHRIIHNLGHTDYVVSGSALGGEDGRNIKFNCYEMHANYCCVVTADDSSSNVSDFMFQITSFR